MPKAERVYDYVGYHLTLTLSSRRGENKTLIFRCLTHCYNRTQVTKLNCWWGHQQWYLPLQVSPPATSSLIPSLQKSPADKRRAALIKFVLKTNIDFQCITLLIPSILSGEKA